MNAHRFVSTSTIVGMAPLEYIHHLRMKRAAILLKGGMLVPDLAFDVGHNTLSSFNRDSLKAYGVSSAQWRKNNIHATVRCGDT